MSEEELNRLIWEVVSKQTNLNTELMLRIADEVRIYFALNKDAINSHNINYEMIEKVLYAKQSEILADISNLTWSVSKSTYADTKDLYSRIGRKFVPFEDNEDIIKATSKVEKGIRKTYADMVKKSSILLKNASGILTPMSIKDAVTNIVNKAKEQIILGVDKFAGFREKLIEVTNSGIRIVRAVGNHIEYSRRIDLALQQELNLSCRDVQLDVYNVVGEQISANGVEISAHIFPALDHEPVQGRQFTNDNFERMQSGYDFSDVDGNHYDGFARPIYGINCKHVTRPIIVGITPQKYSDKQLQMIINNNHKGYTLSNGAHKTMYECTQIQRRLENEIRILKTAILMSKKVGDVELANRRNLQLMQKLSNYKLFSQQAGLPIHPEKLEVR